MEKPLKYKKDQIDSAAVTSTDTADPAKSSALDELLKKSNEKRSKLFTKTTNYIAMKDKKALNAMMNLLAKHKNRNLIPKDNDNIPQQSVLDRVKQLLSDTQAPLPEQLVLLQCNDRNDTAPLASAISDIGLPVISACSLVDLRAVFHALVLRLQQFCNTNSRAPPPVRLALIGSDSFLNHLLRTYVDCLSNRPPDWQQYLKFYPIPLPFGALTGGSNFSFQLAAYFAAVDAQYAQNFLPLNKDAQIESNRPVEFASRVSHYLCSAGVLLQIPIAEAMVMYKRRNSENCLQAFVPFVGNVHIGTAETHQTWAGNQRLIVSTDEDLLPAPSSSPPGGRDAVTRSEMKEIACKDCGNQVAASREQLEPLLISNNSTEKEPLTPLNYVQLTPPNSPGQNTSTTGGHSNNLFTFSPGTLQSPPSTANSPSVSSSNETQDLQIDYWSSVRLPTGEMMRKMDTGKCTLKNTFRTIQISRLPGIGTEFYHTPTLTLSYVTKEKKQKSKDLCWFAI